MKANTEQGGSRDIRSSDTLNAVNVLQGDKNFEKGNRFIRLILLKL